MVGLKPNQNALPEGKQGSFMGGVFTASSSAIGCTYTRGAHHDTRTVMLLHYGSGPLTLNPFQYNLEFGTTHQVALCVVHLRFAKSNQTYNKSQN